MKKFLKIFLSLYVTILAIGFFTLCYLTAHRTFSKYLFGEAKMISPAKEARININGIESNSSQIFEFNGKFYFVTDDSKLPLYDLLVIDGAKNDVALPNSGCHEVFFLKYLFLEDCGYGGVFFGDEVKMSGFNTQLKITNSEINFILPDDGDFTTSKHKIEIIFKGE
jgi:hypothetical protein